MSNNRRAWNWQKVVHALVGVGCHCDVSARRVVMRAGTFRSWSWKKVVHALVGGGCDACARPVVIRAGTFRSWNN